MNKRIKRWIAGVLTVVFMITVMPVQMIWAAPKKLSMQDFCYTYGTEKMYFTDMDEENGRISSLSEKNVKTNRGIAVGSKLSDVTRKYGKASKKKFGKKDSFDKYIKQYYFQYGISISNWKNYVEYTYKKGTKDDRRLRFYLDKNDKVVTVIYIYKYSKYKLTKKTVDIGFSFEVPEGQQIQTKKIAGKTVSILPASTEIQFDNAKLPEFGVLGQINMYDTKGRACGETSVPLNFNNASCASGTKIETILENEFHKYNPKTREYIKTNVKKLGKYNYLEFIIYDIDVKGGYDIPARYYFKLK